MAPVPPVKFVLVDHIYGLKDQTNLESVTGLNAYSMEYYTSSSTGKLSDAHAARLIQIKDWDNTDPNAREEAIRTIVHEVGHSWNTHVGPTKGVANSTWLQNRQSYMQQFEALSGWTSNKNTWNFTAPSAALATEYAKTNPNEDWAETFELASRGDTLPSNPILKTKVQLVKKFLNLVVQTEAVRSEAARARLAFLRSIAVRDVASIPPRWRYGKPQTWCLHG